MFRLSVLTRLPGHKSFRAFCGFVALLVLPGLSFAQTVTPSTTPASKSEVVTSLELGKSVEGQLKGNDVHAYRLDLSLNQYAEVVVDQLSIDVVIWAYDPTGKKLAEVDGIRTGDQEAILLLGEVPGPYRLEIRSSMKIAPEGRYQIKIKELRPGKELDKPIVAASRLMSEGLQLEVKATADSVRKAIAKYQEAIPLWHLAGETEWEADANYLIANLYTFLGDKQKALEFANVALPLARKAVENQQDPEAKKKSITVEAYALDILGIVHNEFGDKKKALEFLNQSLPLRRSIGDRPGELYTTNTMVKVYQSMGDFQKALSLSDGALRVARELSDPARESTVLNNLCVIHDNLGNHKQALDSCQQALSLRRELKDKYGEAITLNNIGNAYSSVGEYQKTLDYYIQSEELYAAQGNKPGQGIQFSNIGWLYATIGEQEKAIEFYNKALEIFTAKNDQFRAGNTLNNIASAYEQLGDYKKALEINLKVIPMRRAVSNNDGLAVSFANTANCYARLGENDKALDYYKQAIELDRDAKPRQLENALRSLGNLYRDTGEQQNAINAFTESLQISRRIGDLAGEAATLSSMARLERDRGNLIEAKRLTETALASVESLRVNLKSQQLRASYFASVRSYHDLYIDVLMRLHQQQPSAGFDAAALKASENARARSLLELLMEANAHIDQGVDPALVAQEQKLRQTISLKAEQQMRLLSGKHTEEDAANMAKEIDTLTSQYEAIQTKIRQTSPRYAALTQPVPLDLKQIQSQLLDENTVLLEYSLGEDRSYVWAITKDSLKTFELPKRATVETTARRVYDLLTGSENNSTTDQIAQRRQRLNHAAESYPGALAELSQMLLGPVSSELKKKRVLIVAEGVLQYVPFSALSDPNHGSSVNNDAVTPLIVKHEIVTLPSASVLSVLRQETAGRLPAPKSVAVFADPVFDIQDSRFAMAKNGETVEPEYREVKRSAAESGLIDFPRLRFSRDEANHIMKIAPRDKSLAALDFAANRKTATSTELQNYRIVHFATHGIINSRHPELSGIVLSLVDQDGQPQNGFLRLYDVYNLKLKADLVVLSACKTALGRDVRGEGLVGLTRAFMYSGATRVVASLWQTDDRASAILMGRFYEGLLSKGMTPADALRSAQVSMWQEQRWRDPRYWAAFTIQGEWK
jgi:CHAT domain-containing protein/Tfp pilus assembly protein PilF